MGDKSTVLIVDDSTTNIRVLADIIADEYDVVVATSGKDALKIIHEENIQLILLDVMMPEMDGFEVCKVLKSDDKTKKIPVIFVTALSSTGDEVKGLELGAVDFITKPFSPIVVKTRIRTHLQLYKYAHELETLARIDGLTGIANRREYDIQIDKEWKRALRNHLPTSLLMMDIDYFKPYNDHYGHGMGDECLRKIGTLLFGIAKRTGDLVARYGGEEFVMLLPHTDVAGAQSIAEEILHGVRELGILHEYSLVSDRVTISIGMGSIAPSEGDHYHLLEKCADEALYKAKASGRNRISSSTCEISETADK